MSQITTHVLDTSKGRPAEGITITLQRQTGLDQWDTITTGRTNEDGRVPNFIPMDVIIEPGVYRMVFETGEYFVRHEISAFYPYVPVVFELFDTEHYHIPLLLNPFGYSTYRGS
jgi:5-hydroxyisourate hydrolase